MPTQNKRVAIYNRVSTFLQANEGLSLQTQLANCIDYAKRKGHEPPYCLYLDSGLSGGTIAKRPQMVQLLADIEAKRIHVLIAPKLDRLFRNVADASATAERLRAVGCILILLDMDVDTSTNSGELLFNVMATVGRFEAKMIGERVHGVNKRLVLEGRHVGGHTPPYGYTRNPVTKELEIDPETAPLIRRIYREYLSQTDKGAPSIARQLNREGLRTPTGKLWDRAHIIRLMRNPVYKGELTYGHLSSKRTRARYGQPDDADWIRAKGSHPPLVSEEEWNAAERKMLARRNPGAAPSPTRLLSGLCYCGHCNSRLYAGQGSGALWQCSRLYHGTRADCPEAKRLYDTILNELVRDALDKNIERADAEGWSERKRPPKAAVKRDTEWERNRLQGRLDRLNRVYIDGGFDGREEEYLLERNSLQSEITRLAKPAEPPALPRLDPGMILLMRQLLSDEDTPLMSKRELIGTLIARILVYGERVEVHFIARPYRGWQETVTLPRPKPWERPRSPRKK